MDPHSKGPILQGSADVLIGGQPAAREGDKVRHGNGTEPIVEGEPTVIVNGRPAARQGDHVACGDVILDGCGSVLIGKSQGRCLEEAAQAGDAFVTTL